MMMMMMMIPVGVFTTLELTGHEPSQFSLQPIKS